MEDTNKKDWDLLSDCCQADFDPLGYEKEQGIWQESCLKCGKFCEPVYTELPEKSV